MATSHIEAIEAVRDQIMATELRIRLMAKLIGPSHHTGSCEELSDDERTTIEDILTTAAEEISGCGEDLERVQWALKAETVDSNG